MLDININYLSYNYEFDITGSQIYNSKEIPPTKTDKNVCIINFDNKLLESIRFPQIFNHSEIIKSLSR